MKALNNKHPIETKIQSDTMVYPKSYNDVLKQIQDYIPEDYNCVSDVFNQLQKQNIGLQEALTLPIEKLFTMIQGKSKLFSQNINKVFTFYKEISKEFTINVINIYTDLRKCTSTDQLISLLDIKNLMGNLDLQFLKDIQLPIKIDQESESSKYQEFIRIYQNHLNFYNNVLKIDCKTCQTDHYVGWKVHWDLVLDFVKSHIQHQSFQVLDVLLILGGPKSGKSLTMYLVAVFLLKFVKLIRPQHSKLYFCKEIAKIIQIDCRDFSSQQPLQKLQTLYFQIAAHIHQTELQKQEANQVDIATISSMIQQMFKEAQCYYIITWDEIQCLFQNTDFYSYKLIGNFIKLIMVCDNSPCQHIVAGSSSVALLSILQDIPVNGNSLLRCQHAIVTTFQAPDYELSILFDQIFKETNDISKAKIIDIIKQVLQQYELSQNCADFDQVLKGITKDNFCVKLLKSNVDELIKLKNQIGQQWIENAINNMSPYNISIFELMIGTKKSPCQMLNKICYQDDKGLYQFLDSSLLSSMKLYLSQKQNEKAQQDVNASEISAFLNSNQKW
ncbi:Hypothetical_protein [Hexamita inflata]|uniref:Hypothetical_protein n=1 Tax=Hexamita inflata TaxID=28002 RepID=A0AA86PY57_9EUKA|nr:Hypothetical protein HINF_LOCUS4685 [Hexamita inflata]CAI9943460.1 Hypothetical protein HINF_LOCUS31105 [Hexamita inflata]